MCATYVDDSLYAGAKEYSNRCENFEQRSTCKQREWDWTVFIVFTIRNWINEFAIYQNNYFSKLMSLDAVSKILHIQFLGAQHYWATNSRPDISFYTALLTKVSDDKPHVNQKCFST